MATKKNTIYKRLIGFQKSMPSIGKNAENPFFKSGYATLDYIQKAIQKPLADAGLGYYQEPTHEGLKTTIFDEEGNSIESVYPATFQGKPQEIGSAVTYAKRYALTAILGLIIEEEDDDGNATVDSKSTAVNRGLQIAYTSFKEKYNKGGTSAWTDSDWDKTIKHFKGSKHEKEIIALRDSAGVVN